MLQKHAGPQHTATALSMPFGKLGYVNCKKGDSLQSEKARALDPCMPAHHSQSASVSPDSVLTLEVRGEGGWYERECVLFIGTQFSILYTSMYLPAGAAL
jgi:hypothetical protein